MNFFRILLATIQTFYNILAPSEIDHGVEIFFVGKSFEDYKSLTSGANFSSLIGTPYFDSSKPTAVMIHGWKTSYKHPEYPGEIFADSYAARGDHNMIFIDWSFWASNENIFKAVSVMRQVAALTSEILRDMESHGFDLNHFHLIGHSLGAQMVGMIGDYFIKNYNFTFQRITGLDPAGAQFFNDAGLLSFLIKGMPSINKNNAMFVDIIHTDSDWNGISEAEGHMDFWLNSGTRYQPGCTIECGLGASCEPCSHLRALKFYFESVNYSSPKFIANLCKEGTEFPNFNNETCNDSTTASMGFYADLEPRTYGNYYLKTNGDSPYSR